MGSYVCLGSFWDSQERLTMKLRFSRMALTAFCVLSILSLMFLAVPLTADRTLTIKFAQCENSSSPSLGSVLTCTWGDSSGCSKTAGKVEGQHRCDGPNCQTFTNPSTGCKSDWCCPNVAIVDDTCSKFIGFPIKETVTYIKPTPECICGDPTCGPKCVL